MDIVGGKHYYERDGEGPPVVLIPGGTLDVRLWAPQVEALSSRYTFVRYDPRGYGRSSEPTDAPYRHCDDLHALLTELGIDRACIGGQSLGATIAIDFTFAHPEVVRGLVLAPALPVLGWEWVEGFPPAPALRLARSEGVDAVKAAFLELPLNASAMRMPAAGATLRQMITDYSGWHLTHSDPGSFEAPDAIERLGEITVPALVLVGGHDVLDSRLTADRLAAELGDPERRVIDHVGHYPNLEDPTAFNELTLGLLDKIHRHAT